MRAAYDEPMSFGRESRRVRDEALPLGHRFRALGSCVQLAQPIWFDPTWSYLEAKVDRSWRDPAFLLPALDLLEAERTLHLSIDEEYAHLRGLQKAAGYRSPPRNVVTPTEPRRWHGDERVGARHTLDALRRLQRGQDLSVTRPGRTVLAAVESALAMPTQPDLDLDELQSILDWARRRIYVVGWESDKVQYRSAWAVYRSLGQLHLLVHDVPPIGTPWNFHTS